MKKNLCGARDELTGSKSISLLQRHMECGEIKHNAGPSVSFRFLLF